MSVQAAFPSFPVIRDADPVPPALRGAVVALGNFDGVHRGHREVIGAARAMARDLRRPALALTFEPHPRAFFQPDVPHFRLSDETNKLRLLATTGIDGVVLIRFTAAFAAVTADDFISRVLIERLGISGAVAGYDFHFGKGRGGNPDYLTATGARRGFRVHIEPFYSHLGWPVSSNAVRAALAGAHLERANDLLGYPWFVTGPVIHGEKRGRDLGFPTANMALDPGCALKHGIYAVRVRLPDGRLCDGVASFGQRPTFDNGAPLLETYLFDFKGDLYGKVLDVAFIAYLRPELKFDGVDALIVQMQDDMQQARAALAAMPDAFPPVAGLLQEPA